MQGVKDLGQIFQLMESNFPLLQNERNEILRSQIVLAVSALDSFLHDLVRFGLLGIFQGIRPHTKGYEGYTVSVHLARLIRDESDLNVQIDLLGLEIRRINSKDSYQSPKGVEYALGLIGFKNLWTNLSLPMGIKPDDIKNTLGLITDRRNKIAHEADFDSVNEAKNAIDRSQTNDVVVFIENLCEAINSLV